MSDREMDNALLRVAKVQQKENPFQHFLTFRKKVLGLPQVK
jgi:hypothetical protein